MLKKDALTAKDEEITSLIADCSNWADRYEKMSRDLKIKDAEIVSLKDTLKKNDQIAANLLNKNIELVELVKSVNLKLDEHTEQLSEKDGEIAWLEGALMKEKG